LKPTRKTTKPIRLGEEWFFPVVIAAERAQMERQTMLGWLERGQTQAGWPVRSIQELETRRFFLAEKSLKEIEERFDSVDTGLPVGAIKIKKTWEDDGKPYYVPIDAASQATGVSRPTLFRWATFPELQPIHQVMAVRDRLNHRLYIPSQWIRDRVSQTRGK
jgi:hypothetical protein